MLYLKKVTIHRTESVILRIYHKTTILSITCGAEGRLAPSFVTLLAEPSNWSILLIYDASRSFMALKVKIYQGFYIDMVIWCWASYTAITRVLFSLFTNIGKILDLFTTTIVL